MSLLLAFLGALDAAIVFMTIVHMIAEYPSLPDRVPLNISWNGVAGNLAPRPAILLLPGAQLFAACVMAYADYAIATHQPGTHGTLLGSLLASAGILAILWRAQKLLIACAKSPGNRVPMNGFWAFFAVAMSVVLFAAFAIG